jgi:hypothetical protein
MRECHLSSLIRAQEFVDTSIRTIESSADEWLDAQVVTWMDHRQVRASNIT